MHRADLVKQLLQAAEIHEAVVVVVVERGADGEAGAEMPNNSASLRTISEGA